MAALFLRRSKPWHVATKCTPTPFRLTSTCTGLRPFGSDAFQKKEQAQEASYFNKEDEKALRKLLKKMKTQTDQADLKGKVDHEQFDMEGLKAILGTAVTPAQVDALLKWKHDQQHEEASS